MLKRLLIGIGLALLLPLSGGADGVVCTATAQATGTSCSATADSATSQLQCVCGTVVSGGGGGTSPGAALAAAAAHWWKLNETSGNRADSVASATLTDHNTVASTNNSPFTDLAADFVATSNEWLDATWDSSFQIGAGDWTWVAWIRPTDSRDEGVVSNYVASNTSSTVLLYMAGGGDTRITGKTVSGTSFSAGLLSPTGSVPLAGAWSMVVFGWDETAKKQWLQINAGTVALSAALGTPNAGTNLLEIGRRSQSTSFDFLGQISRVGFFDRKLTNREVVALYGAGTAPIDYPFTGFSVTDLEVHFIGDSKTAAGLAQSGFVGTLGPDGIAVTHSTNATTGWTMANHAAAIDAYLASSTASPAYILLNIGANDVAALPAEGTWKTNAYYVLDAMHAKWPAAQVYMMRPWRRTEDVDCDTLATWISDVVTARSTFAHLGPDERDFLENGDNGVTYTTDGIHPTAAGYLLTAQQWAAVLGY